MLRAQFFEEMFWLKQSNRKENKRLKENLGLKKRLFLNMENKQQNAAVWNGKSQYLAKIPRNSFVFSLINT